MWKWRTARLKLDRQWQARKARVQELESLPESGYGYGPQWEAIIAGAVMAIIPPPPPHADVQGFKADVAAISAAADGFTVGIRNALRSLDEAKAIQRRVDADSAFLRSKGINITATGITTNGDTVLVDVIGASDIEAVKR